MLVTIPQISTNSKHILTQLQGIVMSSKSIYTSTDRTPYTYLIRWNELNLNYYGRRTAKGCHPEELFITYFTSSKYVSDVIAEHGMPDVIKIHKIFSDTKKCCDQEERFLTRVNASKSLNWLNQTNGDMRWDTTGIPNSESQKQKISNSLKGRSLPYVMTDVIRQNMSISASGCKRGEMSEISKQRKSEALKGRIITWGDKISHSLKGKISPKRGKKLGPSPKFFSLIETKKSYDKGNAIKFFPELFR